MVMKPEAIPGVFRWGLLPLSILSILPSRVFQELKG